MNRKMQFISDIRMPSVLEIIALLVLICVFIYRPLKFLLSWLSNKCDGASRTILKPEPGEYAVITGASDGIGLEYAKQLAKRGYNLVLLSRTEEKLKRVANEIQEVYPQCKEVEYLTVDFTRTDIYDKIRLKLESLNGRIHVLVNNVGIIHPIPDYFASFPDGTNLRMINANMVAMTLMSEIVLRIMSKRQIEPKSRRAKGVIINLSSAAALLPMPMISTYCSSKVYVRSLSEILAVEYAKDNIIVQTVIPGQVDTSLAANYRDSALVVPVDDFVRHALQTVGTEQETSAHPKHKFVNSMTEIVGGWMEKGILRSVYYWAFLRYAQSVRDKNVKKIGAV